MGVTLFDGPKLLTSYLYYDLKGWTYSKTEDIFVLKVKKKDGKAVGETIKFETKHDEKAIIAEAMNEHAQGLAQAKKKQSQASSDAIQEEEEEEPRHDAEWASGVLPELGFEALHNYQEPAWTGGAGASLFASPLFGCGAEDSRAELAEVAAEVRAQQAAAAAAGEDDDADAEAAAHAAIAALKLRRQRLHAVLASDGAAPGGSFKPVVQAGSFERSDVSAPVAQARRARQAASMFDGMFTLFRPVGQPKAGKGSNELVGPIGWTSWSYLTDQA